MFERVECGLCGGTGKCTECHGNGLDATDAVESECVECCGAGRCHECEAAGKRPTWLHDLWAWFWSVNWDVRRLVVAGAVGTVVMTVLFWKVMLPLMGAAIAVTIFLRLSRAKESL